MTVWSATFGVLGKPEAKGSMKPYQDKITGRLGLKPNYPKRLKDWEGQVRLVASRYAPPQPLTGPVSVRLIFTLTRPATVKESRRPLPVVYPDIDKLERAVLDPLTKVIWADDAQVVELIGRKIYGAPQGVSVTIRELHSEADLGTMQ
jgi:crossover junction endodeoxyribonuclease RusA